MTHGSIGRVHDRELRDGLLGLAAPPVAVENSAACALQAVDAIVQTEAMVRPTGFVFILGDVMLAKTEVYRTAGRLEDAARAAGEALEIFERKEFAMYTHRARRLLAEVG